MYFLPSFLPSTNFEMQWCLWSLKYLYLLIQPSASEKRKAQEEWLEASGATQSSNSTASQRFQKTRIAVFY
jgi:hypothetical protein